MILCIRHNQVRLTLYQIVIAGHGRTKVRATEVTNVPTSIALKRKARGKAKAKAEEKEKEKVRAKVRTSLEEEAAQQTLPEAEEKARVKLAVVPIPIVERHPQARKTEKRVSIT